MRVFDARGNNIEALAFSPGGRFLTVGSYSGMFEVWNPSGAATRFRVTGRLTQFAFHPRLPLAFAVIGRSFWSLVHTEGAMALRDELCTHTDRFALSPDGSAAVVSGRFDLNLSGNRLRMFDVSGDGLVTSRWADPPEGAGNLHGGLTWVPGTERFAVAELTGNYPNQRALITLRDTATGGIVATRDRAGPTDNDLAASPDGTLIAATGATISIWPRADLTLSPHVIRNDGKKHFTGIAFHPSGRVLAATSNDTTVKLYDTTTWGTARTFTWDIGRMRSIAFSPDGTLAAVGSDSGKVVVWDVDP